MQSIKPNKSKEAALHYHHSTVQLMADSFSIVTNLQHKLQQIIEVPFVPVFSFEEQEGLICHQVLLDLQLK